MGMEIASKEFVDENKGSSVKYDYCGYSGNYAGYFGNPNLPYFAYTLPYIRRLIAESNNYNPFNITGILFYGLVLKGVVEEGRYRIALVNMMDTQLVQGGIIDSAKIIAISNNTYDIATDKEIFNVALKLISPIRAGTVNITIFPSPMAITAVKENEDGTFSAMSKGGLMIRTDNSQTYISPQQITSNGVLRAFGLYAEQDNGNNAPKLGVVLQTAPADDLTD